jgi:hypothetical protein
MQHIGINVTSCVEYIKQYMDVTKSTLLQGDAVVDGI